MFDQGGTHTYRFNTGGENQDIFKLAFGRDVRLNHPWACRVKKALDLDDSRMRRAQVKDNSVNPCY